MTRANPVVPDMLAEYRALADFCQGLGADDWQRRSDFYGWTPWDEVAHLAYFDRTALCSIEDAPRFAREAAELGALMQRGDPISAVARQAFAGLDGPGLLAGWRRQFEALAVALDGLDPKARLAWYGPPMSARSFATARLMETWAHGQDVWDVMQQRRPASARLKHIAHLGVTTFGWTFVNRGLPVPEPQPYVELQAPDGAAWTWGEPGSAHFIRGTAEDFCLLVTQRRHVDDTTLQYSAGPVAQWVAMAQCFAGPPADGPAPGVRKTVVAAVGAAAAAARPV